MKKSFNPLLAVALATTPLVAGCQTVPKTLDMKTCAYTHKNITGLFQSVVPGFRSLKPSLPCIYSNDFMALVDVVQTGDNIKNHYMTGSLVSTYDELQQTRGKFASETLKLIDTRLNANGLSIDTFRSLRDQYRPREQSRTTENICIKVTIEQFGRLEDMRFCRIPETAPIPQ